MIGHIATQTIAEQVPALNFEGHFYALSLRMMKCIWRHTRLRKGFRNLECGHFGMYKLRVPRQLMQEKIRGHPRANVSAFARGARAYRLHAAEG